MQFLGYIELIHKKYPMAKFRVADYMVELTIECGGRITIHYLDRFGNLRTLIDDYGTKEERVEIYNYMLEWSKQIIQEMEKEDGRGKSNF